VNPRRLYRSRRDRQLAGVAGGMAEYLEIDPTIVRLLWIASIFLGGFGILLYIIMAFIVPLDPRQTPAGGPWQAPDGGMTPDGGVAPDGTTVPQWTSPDAGRESDTRGGRAGLIIGVMLIAFGAIALANVLLPGWAVGAALGPAFVVAVGIALVVGAARRKAPAESPEP
jgi:phage shock protein C